MIYQEENLSFDFPDDLSVIKPDKKGAEIPQGMKSVDFVIEKKDEIYLIEVKDPFQAQIPTLEKEKNIKQLCKGKSIINEIFVPKARDSYTCLHLMKKDDKPIIYIVLIAEGDFEKKNDLEILLSTGFKTYLERRLKKETEIPWKRKYITNCIVLTTRTWKKQFPTWTIKRISPDL